MQRTGNLEAILWRAGYDAHPDRESDATIDLRAQVETAPDPPSEPAR